MDLVLVKLSVVVPQLGGLEVTEEQAADFGSDCSQTTTEVFVSFVIGGDV